MAQFSTGADRTPTWQRPCSSSPKPGEWFGLDGWVSQPTTHHGPYESRGQQRGIHGEMLHVLGKLKMAPAWVWPRRGAAPDRQERKAPIRLNGPGSFCWTAR